MLYVWVGLGLSFALALFVLFLKFNFKSEPEVVLGAPGERATERGETLKKHASDITKEAKKKREELVETLKLLEEEKKRFSEEGSQNGFTSTDGSLDENNPDPSIINELRSRE